MPESHQRCGSTFKGERFLQRNRERRAKKMRKDTADSCKEIIKDPGQQIG